MQTTMILRGLQAFRVLTKTANGYVFNMKTSSYFSMSIQMVAMHSRCETLSWYSIWTAMYSSSAIGLQLWTTTAVKTNLCWVTQDPDCYLCFHDNKQSNIILQEALATIATSGGDHVFFMATFLAVLTRTGDGYVCCIEDFLTCENFFIGYWPGTLNHNSSKNEFVLSDPTPRFLLLFSQ